MGIEWSEAPLAPVLECPPGSTLLVLDAGTTAIEAIAAQVPAMLDVIGVAPGIAFERIARKRFALDPSEPEDWGHLVATLGDAARRSM